MVNTKTENDMSSELASKHRTSKSENEMSDEELEEFENKTRVNEDIYDDLERFRLFLNNTRIEQMFHLKRSTKLGPQCPYYIKSKKLFEEKEKEVLIKELESVLSKLKQ